MLKIILEVLFVAYAVNSSAVITDTKGQLEKSMPPENTRVTLPCVKWTTTSPTFLRIDGEVSWSLFPSSLSCAITQYSTTRKCLFLYRPGKKKMENYESIGICMHWESHHLTLLHCQNYFKSKHFSKYWFETEDVHIQHFI